MEAELRDRWVKALRSGQYRQGHGLLRDGDAFCPLGILYDIWTDEQGWVPLPNEKDCYATRLAPKNGEHWAFEEYEQAGLTRDMADVLAQMNDEGQSFEQIANYIETRL